MENLRSFLIKHFLIILGLVTIAEYGVLYVTNWLFLPLFQNYFFGKMHWKGSLGITQLFLYLLFLFIELLLLAVKSVLPAAAQTIFQRAIGSMENFGRELLPEMGDNIAIQLSSWESLLLFAAVFAIMILLLIPYAVGAMFYARITSRKVRELQDKRDAIREEYHRKRNRMLSDIAHDLRTPITTVAGYAKALSDGMVEDPQKVQEYLNAIQVKSARIEELIQLLFEYVKLSSEGFTLNKKETDLCELLRKNAALMYSDIENAGMEFEIAIPEKICMVEADELQFSRAITNLLTNAIRHNKAGAKILLSLSIEDDSYEIRVGDTGEIIAPELVEHLFEPFVMGDESRSTKGGSGLGLSISHKIMEMHGWKLSYSEQIDGYTKCFVMEKKTK